MPPASNNVCVTADLNASTDNSFSAMNCLLADGYSPVTQGDPRRPASRRAPLQGREHRGPPPRLEHPPAVPSPSPSRAMCPAASQEARVWEALRIGPVHPETQPCPERGGGRRCRVPVPALPSAGAPAAPSSSEWPRVRRRGDAHVHTPGGRG